MTAAGSEHERSRRATIADIALKVGVTKGAVSYALNGKPGVSEETRRRVLEAAHELRWVPSSAARMLAGNRTSTVGLALTRRPETLGDEPFLMGFVAGLEAALQPRGYGLLLQVPTHTEAELETYRAWAGQRRVDGVVVLDPVSGDPRPQALEALGLPAVVVGQARPGHGLAGLVTDDAVVMRAVVDHLADLGHTAVARVAGPARLLHTERRDRAFTAACRRRGVRARTVHADYSGDEGAEATAALVVGASGGPRPTAVVYDNDLMAVAGLSRLVGLGLRVPDDVSLVAWDDSATCRATHPALTATGHDVVAFGRAAGEALFALLNGDGPTTTTTTPELRVRASTAQAPSPSAGAAP